MNVIEFEGCNTIYAKDQDQYLPLPCHKTGDGTVTSCWKLTFIERLQVVFMGKIYLKVLTFNNPLQPLKMSTTLDCLFKTPPGPPEPPRPKNHHPVG